MIKEVTLAVMSRCKSEPQLLKAVESFLRDTFGDQYKAGMEYHVTDFISRREYDRGLAMRGYDAELIGG